MPESIPMSAEEIARLEAEFHRLKTEGRRKAREELVKARAYGDFRENAEFEEAKRAQSVLEGRIVELGDILGRAKLAEPGSVASIAVGAAVTVVDCVTQAKFRFNVRATAAAALGDPDTITVTPDSPIGRALMGKAADDEIEVATPSGTRRYRVVMVG